MGLFRSLGGMVRLKVTGSDIPKTIRKLNEAGIPMYEIKEEGNFTVCFFLERRHHLKAEGILNSLGDSVDGFDREGIYYFLKQWLHRPILLLGVLVLTFLTLYLPTRILFVTVEGNENLPSRQIIAAAGECGIQFGASRSEVRSEKVKNRLLEAMPQLQWAGVNTRGCVAIISVRERSQITKKETHSPVEHIVASRDGVILSCTTTAGTAVCQPGEAVQKGQILISGYTDCGIVLRAEAAQGRVDAQTVYEITAAMPSEYAMIREEATVSKNFTLLIGKNRINLWKGSGNSGGTCGRMYEEYYITLPGGYQLPFGIAMETDTTYRLEEASISQSLAEDQLLAKVRTYLLSHMIDGKIVDQLSDFTATEQLYILTGQYICTEMIGRAEAEQIGERNE